MFLLDTNVISTFSAPAPPSAVISWANQQPNAELYTATICQAELLAGLAQMPFGQRRLRLAEAIHQVFMNYFGARVLAFDGPAAEAYGDVITARRRARLAINQPLDLLIAAIALAHSATVVTRNTADFEACGIAVLDPWLAGAQLR